MAAGLNKIMVIGNLGTDPEMRYTPSGKPVTTFRLATNRSYRAEDGERRDEDSERERREELGGARPTPPPRSLLLLALFAHDLPLITPSLTLSVPSCIRRSQVHARQVR